MRFSFQPELPDFNKVFREAEATVEEKRSYAIKNGIQPPVSFAYKPLNITNSGEIFDPYVPAEGDGKASLISGLVRTTGIGHWPLATLAAVHLCVLYLQGVNQLIDKGKSKATQFRHIRKIRQYDEQFDAQIFGDLAQVIFVNAHEVGFFKLSESASQPALVYDWFFETRPCSNATRRTCSNTSPKRVTR
jgi:large subunit ribosomal protein L45